MVLADLSQPRLPIELVLKSSLPLTDSDHMGKLWFVYANQVVSGPLTTDQVKSRLAAGGWPKDTYIWWKGQREWLSISVWEGELSRLAKSDEQSATPIWYVDNGSGSGPVGPMTDAELVDSLRGVAKLDRIRVWSSGMQGWTSVYQVPDVMDLLGISRRAHERAPLMGVVTISRPFDGLPPLSTKAASISVDGMGVNGAGEIRKGDRCQLLLKSPEFPAGLHLQADAIYVMANGYAGFKFTRPHPEAQSLIHDYIRRFLEPGATALAGSPSGTKAA